MVYGRLLRTAMVQHSQQYMYRLAQANGTDPLKRCGLPFTTARRLPEVGIRRALSTLRSTHRYFTCPQIMSSLPAVTPSGCGPLQPLGSDHTALGQPMLKTFVWSMRYER